MKKTIIIMAAALAALSFSSCQKLDPWNGGDPSQDHVYFIGFNWGETTAVFNKNGVKYDVTQGKVVDIDYIFESGFVRDYDVDTYFYVDGTLVEGTDYQIVDASGARIAPGANGAYKVTWPQAKKGNQPIHFKALNGAKGSVKVTTIDAGHVKPDANDLTTLIQHEETNYTVRIFSNNHYVTVTVK